ncbi:MAG: M23 family metallopeptidase [Treponema sp.]|nr:M23 family metallopeptidase [Treponema sp.]
MKKRIEVFSVLLLLVSVYAHSQAFTRIPELVSRNPVFKQYQKQIEEANKAVFMGKNPADYLYFYEYQCTEKDKLLQLAARCAIRYDTIATLNRLDSPEDELNGRVLLLPTLNGLFIPYSPQTATEILLAKEYSVDALSGKYESFDINGTEFFFLPDEKFSPTERAYFLEPGMVLPLEKSVLTSSFGMRVSPISGKWLFHKGIDMAAPTGTSIYACKAGTVQYAVSMDATYGNYVILNHGGGMTSLYAHMSKMLVEKGEAVTAGQVIGKVGSTGLATGPHLHFEIRMNGEAQDPQKYLPKKL